MITGKQRAYLRKMAHQLEPIFQIGKEGVTDAFIDGLNKALTKREILKVHILRSECLILATPAITLRNVLERSRCRQSEISL